MTAIAVKKANGGVRDPRGALDMLMESKWITTEQYEAGLMFGELWKHDDPYYAAVRREVLVDLVKFNALDLVTHVCRDHDIHLAVTRLDALRDGLNAVALRFKQIGAAAEELGRSPRPSAASVAR